jgi:hypothetical protein
MTDTSSIGVTRSGQAGCDHRTNDRNGVRSVRPVRGRSELDGADEAGRAGGR